MAEQASRGYALLQSKQILRKNHGEDVLSKVMSKCTDETRKIVTGALISSDYYPDTYFADFCQAVRDTIGEEKFKEYGREIGRTQLNTVLKLFARMFVSPQKYAENGPKLWAYQHNSGVLEVVANMEKTQSLKLTGYDFINTAYETGFTEYRCGILEVLGAKNVRGTCLKSGNKQYIMRWNWD